MEPWKSSLIFQERSTGMREEKRFPDLCDYCEIFNPNQELIDLLKEDILKNQI